MELKIDTLKLRKKVLELTKSQIGGGVANGYGPVIKVDEKILN